MTEKKSGEKRNARVNRPERHQVEMQFFALDQMVPVDHRVRLVWDYVGSLDLELLYGKFINYQSNAGRNAIAPEILVCAWLMATLDSISSARELARRCQTDIIYMWICGGVTVNYHTLSDFRSNNSEFFEELLIDTITAMMHEGFVDLATVGQDGMRVRASAGNSSFRRQKTLKELHQEAEKHVRSLEDDDDNEKGSGGSAGQQAARKRAANEREQRIRDSLEQVKQLREQKEKRQKGDGVKARCSTTDPDARRMKMGDGGWRPAYNFQFATDQKSRMIVAVDVTNSGSDRGKMKPLQETLRNTYQKTPEMVLVDSAFATHGDVTALEQAGSQVVAPIPRASKLKEKGGDPHSRQPRESKEFGDFRNRMAEQRYKTIYQQRPSIAEFPNAECRNRGCRLLRVRGLKRVKSVALLYANAFNLLRLLNIKQLATT